MSHESKPIRKTDDGSIKLLYEIFGDDYNKISKIDSYYNHGGEYTFLEFIKCESSPYDYDINKNWSSLYKQISIIWEFTQKAGGNFWIICYSDEKKDFKLLRIEHLDERKIYVAEELKQDFAAFKIWFQKLNSDVLKK